YVIIWKFADFFSIFRTKSQRNSSGDVHTGSAIDGLTKQTKKTRDLSKNPADFLTDPAIFSIFVNPASKICPFDLIISSFLDRNRFFCKICQSAAPRAA